jgi:hypothetical protein
MKIERTAKILLTLAVLLLGIVALRPLIQPASVSAQSTETRRFYVEPGTTMLRKPDGTAQVYGKVFIDMQTGDVWGFPTNTTDPYPSNPASSEPPKSHPMYLGKFVLSDAVRK